MNIQRLKQDFSVCQVADYSDVDVECEYCFTAATDAERSLVCPTDRLPPNPIRCESGWRAFRIQGELDFSLVGVLAKIAALMAENGIGIFAVSTYNTDYIFLKKENFDKAMTALSRAGYSIL